MRQTTLSFVTLTTILYHHTGATQRKQAATCFDTNETFKLKYFYPESEGFNITIKSSLRQESRCVCVCVCVCPVCWMR